MNHLLVESLAARIKVCVLNQGVWNPRKPHKNETREEIIRHGLEHKDADVYIRLTKHESLLKASAVKGQIYIEHQRLTMSSPCKGMRILPAGREFEHSSKLSNLSVEFNQHVDLFVSDYDNVIDVAKRKFKNLLDGSMFPPKEIIREKFYNRTRYMSAPTSGEWGNWILETADICKIELQDRIVAAARKLIETCANDGKLYSSVLDNLGEICDMAGDFNLLEDPIIAKAVKELKPLATEFPAEVLRESKALRRDTGNRAQQILTVLNLG